MELFPKYLALGCSYEEYWNGEPWIASAYIAAQKHRLEEQNQMMWYQGIYFYDALTSALSAFGDKHKNYMDKPINIFNEDTNATKVQNEVINALNRFQDAWNKNKQGK